MMVWIGLHHLAGERRVDVGGGLDAFHHGAGFVGGDVAADLGEFDEHHVAELFLGVVGDADGGDVAIQSDPFMFLGEADVGGWFGHRDAPWVQRA